MSGNLSLQQVHYHFTRPSLCRSLGGDGLFLFLLLGFSFGRLQHPSLATLRKV